MFARLRYFFRNDFRVSPRRFPSLFGPVLQRGPKGLQRDAKREANGRRLGAKGPKGSHGATTPNPKKPISQASVSRAPAVRYPLIPSLRVPKPRLKYRSSTTLNPKKYISRASVLLNRWPVRASSKRIPKPLACARRSKGPNTQATQL